VNEMLGYVAKSLNKKRKKRKVVERNPLFFPEMGNWIT
jgi:hypothetical protein